MALYLPYIQSFILYLIAFRILFYAPLNSDNELWAYIVYLSRCFFIGVWQVEGTVPIFKNVWV